MNQEHEDLLERSWGEVVWDWLESRNYWLLLFALPALLGFVGVAVFAFHQFAWRPTRAAMLCADMAGRAQNAGDHARAQLAWRNHLRLSRTAGEEQLYRLAQCYSHLGRRADAVALLSALAPLDKSGYAPAHLFLAQALLLGPEVSDQAIRVAESHLLRLLQLDARHADAQQLLGQIYLTQGQYEDARKQLTAVVSARPESALHLALAHRGLGDPGASRAWADRAAKFFASRVAQTTTNDTSLRLNWADSLALMNDFAGAAAVLEAGLRRGADPAYRPALARVCLSWADALAREQPTQVVRRLEIIQRGLEAMPENLDLLRELALLSGAPGEEAAAARRHVNELLADDRHAPLLRFCLGGVARQRGDLAEARAQFEAAFAAAPTVAQIANALADVLVAGNAEDLAKARQLADALAQGQPANPAFRETRGRVLLRQGELESALVDLEFALPLLAEKAPAHQALAQVYDRLGVPDMAAEHRRRADAKPAAR